MKKFLLHPVCYGPGAALLALGVFGIQNRAFFDAAFQPDGDLATLVLQVMRAVRFEQYLGPYSRFEFHHPGPLVFYLQAFLAGALPGFRTLTGEIFFVDALLNGFFLAVGGHLLWRVSGQRGLVALYVPCFLLLPVSLVEPWGPRIGIVPLATSLIGASLVATGRLGPVFVTTFAAACAVNMTVGNILIVGPVALVAVGAAVRAHWTQPRLLRRGERASIVAALALVLLNAVPVLVEQLAFEPGNLTRLVWFFVDGAAQRHSLADSTRFVLAALTRPLDLLLAPASVWMPAARVAGVLGLAWGSFETVRAIDRPALRYCIGFAWATPVLGILGGTGIRGPLYDFLFLHQTAAASVLFTALGFAVARRLGVARRPLLVLGLSWVLSVLAVRGAHVLVEAEYVDRDARFERMREAVAPDAGAPLRFELGKDGPSHAAWHDMTGLALLLETRRHRFCVDDEWLFMLGEQFRCAADADGYRTLTLRDPRRDEVRADAVYRDERLALELKVPGARPARD